MTEWEYTCVHCGRVSHNPMDALERYCGACRQWSDDHTSSLSYHWILDEEPASSSCAALPVGPLV